MPGHIDEPLSMQHAEINEVPICNAYILDQLWPEEINPLPIGDLGDLPRAPPSPAMRETSGLTLK
jgi:hypothetical protein